MSTHSLNMPAGKGEMFCSIPTLFLLESISRTIVLEILGMEWDIVVEGEKPIGYHKEGEDVVVLAGDSCLRLSEATSLEDIACLEEAGRGLLSLLETLGVKIDVVKLRFGNRFEAEFCGESATPLLCLLAPTMFIDAMKTLLNELREIEGGGVVESERGVLVLCNERVAIRVEPLNQDRQCVFVTRNGIECVARKIDRQRFFNRFSAQASSHWVDLARGQHNGEQQDANAV